MEADLSVKDAIKQFRELRTAERPQTDRNEWQEGERRRPSGGKEGGTMMLPPLGQGAAGGQPVQKKKKIAARTLGDRPETTLSSKFSKVSGAPEAWQLSKDMKKANKILRRELNHVTYLRDYYKTTGSTGSIPRGGIPPPTFEMGEHLSRSQTRASNRIATGDPNRVLQSRKGAVSAPPDASRNATPMLMSWSKQLGDSGPPTAHDNEPIRPSSEFLRRFMERQPKVGLCLLWNNTGQKRLEVSEQAIQTLSTTQENDRRKKRKLLEELRDAVQHGGAVNTQTLAAELWRLFRKADLDKSGRLEYPEFSKILRQVGLSAEKLGEESLHTLYSLADKDKNGSIDFSEFLSAVVGNLVSV